MRKTTKREVREFIALMRKGAPEVMRAVFTRGGCFAFHQILANRFPGAVPYTTKVEGGHVITRIGDSYWDIDGQRNPSARSIRIGSNYRPMTAKQIGRAKRWRCSWSKLIT